MTKTTPKSKPLAQDFSADGEIGKPSRSEPTKTAAKSGFSFKGCALHPYSFSMELLLTQVTDPLHDTNLFNWLAFIFLHQVRDPKATPADDRQHVVALAWNVFAFRTELLEWLDRIGPLTMPDHLEAKRLFTAMRAPTPTAKKKATPRAAVKITSNAPQLAATFREYAKYYRHKVGPELVQEQARKLATELFVQARAVAPTKADITADVQRQGWKIPAKFADGRIGRGEAKERQRIEGLLAVKAARRGRGRGRLSKAEKIAGKLLRAQFTGGRETLADMLKYVAAHRINAILYVASGFLGAVADLGGSLKLSSGKVDSSRGRAEIRPNQIVIVNDTPGILEVEAAHSIQRRAFEARIADMRVYIKRKVREAQSQVFRKAA